MTSYHPKFYIHTALQLVGLTTEKLLPTALNVLSLCVKVILKLNVLLCINVPDNDAAACSNSTTAQLPLTTTAVLLLATSSLQLRKEHGSMGSHLSNCYRQVYLMPKFFSSHPNISYHKSLGCSFGHNISNFEGFL